MSQIRLLDNPLDGLKNHIREMCGCVEKSLGLIKDSLKSKQTSLLEKVAVTEAEVNRWHKVIDEEVFLFLAQYNPLAKDLRWCVGLIKMNTDLERIGDQCMNLSYNLKDYLNRGSSHNEEGLKTLFEMTCKVEKMLKLSIEAFTTENLAEAKNLLKMDDEIDQLKSDVFKTQAEWIQKNPQYTLQGLDLILMARNLERIADHSTNIAEDIIFVTTGDDVRHQKS